ncbi:MAG: DUF1893 domain-containing protein [Niameybacter sp.]|uniref:DUF1893 domain-containing protein n=1 Tax=Niameybacter sp. TaxID=2033640 RepID=UPI002FC65B3F
MTPKKLKQVLNEKEASCILFQEEQVLMTSYEKGVLPLWRFMTEQKSLPTGDLEVADKMVGRAVAYLLVSLGVSQVYTKVISETALEVLKDYPIRITYDELVPFILNRTRDGQCPMEQALTQVVSVKEAYDLIDTFVRRRLAQAQS